MKKYHDINKVHQITILGNGKLPDNLPKIIENNISCIKEFYPDSEYKMWSGEDIRQFLLKNFSEEVLWAYDKIKPYAYKCDLARLCVLYIHGGMYIDLGVRLMNKWDIPSAKGLAAFRDVPFITPSWTALQNGLIWSLPGRPELKKAIDWIVENCRTRYYGSQPLYPTGPVLFGRACVATMVERGQNKSADDQHVGNCRCITPDAKMLNVAYVSKEGVVVALRAKKTGGDLRDIGISGSNNYNDIWRARQMYSEENHVWDFDDLNVIVEGRATRTKTGIAVASGAEGRVFYGPFATLEGGSYRLKIEFSPETKFSRFFVDICAGNGNNVINCFNFQDKSIKNHDSIDLDFVLSEFSENVEFRASVFGEFSGEIRRLTVTKSDRKEIGDRKEIDNYRQIWDFRSKQIQLIGVSRTSTGILIPKGTKGRVMFGPYCDLKSGEYTLKIFFGDKTRFSKIMIDISGGNTHESVYKFNYKKLFPSYHSEIEFPFSLAYDQTGVEFRLHVDRDFSGEFVKYDLISK
ncbi:hypothetical protein Gdia_0658 [Gluconacetobacter diazotrophicus PA1 5]|uniref:glycosyltransferase family 32 protein n=1 Tax=Gluconacetobacter diazotrophicus TaxID=33996 RepID=UPI000173AF6A|nr:glycosyltransferase [Gluconacetobacter diazotrophicus]ACI50449.1 hypothetical protein Gdia_0658 [Gluconacetobacter diazotrophicus PA1 5]TWA98320.1 glycosyl transferase-like sugar-binding protein [Gluconacetobacter diazotrophicus]